MFNYTGFHKLSEQKSKRGTQVQCLGKDKESYFTAAQSDGSGKVDSDSMNMLTTRSQAKSKPRHVYLHYLHRVSQSTISLWDKTTCSTGSYSNNLL